MNKQPPNQPPFFSILIFFFKVMILDILMTNHPKIAAKQPSPPWYNVAWNPRNPHYFNNSASCWLPPEKTNPKPCNVVWPSVRQQSSVSLRPHRTSKWAVGCQGSRKLHFSHDALYSLFLSYPR